MWQRVQQVLDLFRSDAAANPNYRGSSSSTPSPSAAAVSSSPTLPRPCSELYDRVLDLDWPRVIQHCHDHPQDAHFQEGDGLETPLYLACQWNPPLDVIQALIQANPEALLLTSREHRDLPVHMICRSKATTVEVLEEFVIRQPSTVSHATKYGSTALYVLWNAARPDCMRQDHNASIIRPFTLEQHQQMQQFWAKMELLVDAMAKSRQHSWPEQAADNNDNLYRVHGLVSLGALGCPLAVLQYICDKYPHELSARDATGQLPLHLAVGPSQWSPSGIRKYKPREQAIIQLLLARYPQAAHERLFSRWDYYDTTNGKRKFKTTTLVNNQKTTTITMDRNGRYPLHIALANRHTWEGGVRDLFHAAPEVLSIKDPVTQLYPFQMAAVPLRDNLLVDTGTILQLLRQRTELIEDGAVACCGGTPTDR